MTPSEVATGQTGQNLPDSTCPHGDHHLPDKPFIRVVRPVGRWCSKAAGRSTEKLVRVVKPPEEFTLRLRALADDAPAIVRLRRLLKSALRQWGFRCVDVRRTETSDQGPARDTDSQALATVPGESGGVAGGCCKKCC